MRWLVPILVSCAFLPTAWLVLVLDQWSGASCSFAFQGFFISLAILIGLLVMHLSTHEAFLLMPIAFILFILTLRFVDTSPVKPAIRAVREIQPGMAETQVRSVFDRQFPEDGRFRRPELGPVEQGILTFSLDPDDGRYNAACNSQVLCWKVRVGRIPARLIHGSYRGAAVDASAKLSV